MTSDEADDRYGSVNIAEHNSFRLTGVKLSAVITLQTHWAEKVGHEIKTVWPRRVGRVDRTLGLLLRDVTSLQST